jgi:glycosyltransferase involved in cell wall biosynthesis
VTRERSVWFVVPEGVDELERVSGGNVYDRQVRDGLRRRGWEVRMLEVPDAEGLARSLASVDHGHVAMIDGLVAAWSPEVVESTSQRARVIVIAHMVAAAFADATPEMVEGERRALRHADRVIATSAWAAAELVRRGLVDDDRMAVVAPGSRDRLAEVGPAENGDLLCIGVVAPHKGQDLLMDALGRLHGQDWRCTMAGSRAVAPEFATRVAADAARFPGRVRMTGVLGDAALDHIYQRAGVLVAPSRAESFGMAIADARRSGLPIIATAVDGIPDTVIGGGAILVPADDPAALATALQRWISEPELRARLRAEAAQVRDRAPRWRDTVTRFAQILGSA